MPTDPPFLPQNAPSHTRLPPHRHRQPSRATKRQNRPRCGGDTTQGSPPEPARALWGCSLSPHPFGSHRRFQPLIN